MTPPLFTRFFKCCFLLLLTQPIFGAERVERESNRGDANFVLPEQTESLFENINEEVKKFDEKKQQEQLVNEIEEEEKASSQYGKRFRLLVAASAVLLDGESKYVSGGSEIKMNQTGALRKPVGYFEASLRVFQNLEFSGSFEGFENVYPNGIGKEFQALESRSNFGIGFWIFPFIKIGLEYDAFSFGYTTADIGGSAGSFSGNLASAKGFSGTLLFRQTATPRFEIEALAKLRYIASISGAELDRFSSDLQYSSFLIMPRIHYLLINGFFLGPNFSYEKIRMKWQQGVTSDISNSYSSSELKFGFHFGVCF